MTTEEVGAAAEARKRYNEIKGKKKQKPWKIVEEVVGKSTGRFFKCRYHDVGYGGQDYDDVHDESYLRQFDGFMEDYEAVSAALPPPLQCVFFIAFHTPFHLILIFLRLYHGNACSFICEYNVQLTLLRIGAAN